MQTTKHTSKRSTRCHQKSKTGVSVVPRKGLMSSKNNLKNKTKKHTDTCGDIFAPKHFDVGSPPPLLTNNYVR